MTERENEMKRMLIRDAELLERWAAEAKDGGWSTQSVKTMLARASEIRNELFRIGVVS